MKTAKVENGQASSITETPGRKNCGCFVQDKQSYCDPRLVIPSEHVHFRIVGCSMHRNAWALLKCANDAADTFRDTRHLLSMMGKDIAANAMAYAEQATREVIAAAEGCKP